MEENTILPTPVTRIASSSASVPPRLLSQYSEGLATDSATSDFAAKCRTASTPSASMALACSRTRPSVKAAPAGTASACPVDRSSRMATWCPSRSAIAATTLPM